MYAQSLSLISEELDADTVYSFVPNIGDSDPSSRCTYSKITNGADVDLNHSFLKQVLRTQLCVHHDAVVIVIWVIWSKCASKRTKMCVMENPRHPLCISDEKMPKFNTPQKCKINREMYTKYVNNHYAKFE